MLLDKTLVHYKYPSKKMGITGAITLYFSYTFWYSIIITIRVWA